jgi:hypothetical protein
VGRELKVLRQPAPAAVVFIGGRKGIKMHLPAVANVYYTDRDAYAYHQWPSPNNHWIDLSTGVQGSGSIYVPSGTPILILGKAAPGKYESVYVSIMFNDAQTEISLTDLNDYTDFELEEE